MTTADDTIRPGRSSMAVVRVWNHLSRIDDGGRHSIDYLDAVIWSELCRDLFADLDVLECADVRFHGQGIDVSNTWVEQARAECFCLIVELLGNDPAPSRSAVNAVIDAYPIDAAWWLLASNDDRVLHGSFPSQPVGPVFRGQEAPISMAARTQGARPVFGTQVTGCRGERWPLQSVQRGLAAPGAPWHRPRGTGQQRRLRRLQ